MFISILGRRQFMCLIFIGLCKVVTWVKKLFSNSHFSLSKAILCNNSVLTHQYTLLTNKVLWKQLLWDWAVVFNKYKSVHPFVNTMYFLGGTTLNICINHGPKYFTLFAFSIKTTISEKKITINKKNSF